MARKEGSTRDRGGSEVGRKGSEVGQQTGDNLPDSKAFRRQTDRVLWVGCANCLCLHHQNPVNAAALDAVKRC